MAVILTDKIASVSDLKRNPMGTVKTGEGGAVAILNRNEPAFYCVPAQAYEEMMERLENPHVPASRLFGSQNRYKLKLRSVGYRLVYEVRDEVLVVIVIAVGKRDKSMVYKAADKR
jgi:mRNA interferase RelE/StbE